MIYQLGHKNTSRNTAAVFSKHILRSTVLSIACTKIPDLDMDLETWLLPRPTSDTHRKGELVSAEDFLLQLHCFQKMLWCQKVSPGAYSQRAAVQSSLCPQLQKNNFPPKKNNPRTQYECCLLNAIPVCSYTSEVSGLNSSRGVHSRVQPEQHKKKKIWF